jgi:hypothetical protein
MGAGDPPPGKLYLLKLEFSRILSGRTCNEEEPVHEKADHRKIEAARGWGEDIGSVP